MSTYDYDIKYKPGVTLIDADTLSRIPLPETTSSDTRPASVIHLIDHLQDCPVDADTIRMHTCRYPILARATQVVLNGGTLPPHNPDFLPFKARRNEPSVEYGCLLRGSRVVIPRVLRPHVLEKLHQAHPGMARMKALARGGQK